ncbi:MAG: ArsR family transcriptional regulator [Porphyromonadaceae bacterium]|nr:ArsR family transcriptional regulator [Porphyromonadaceae bacterium]
MGKLKLSDKEEELIRAIRNYQKARHNPSAELLYYAQQLFDELTDD